MLMVCVHKRHSVGMSAMISSKSTLMSWMAVASGSLRHVCVNISSVMCDGGGGCLREYCCCCLPVREMAA